MPEQTHESNQPEQEQAGTEKPPRRRAHPWDANIRWLANFPDTLWELLRLTLAGVVYRNLDRNFHPRPLPTRVEGGDFLIDEADLGLLAKHTDGRPVVSAYEHKSDKTKLAELQVVSSAFRLTRQLVEDGVTTWGEVPILNGVIVLNGKATQTRPKSLAELAKLTPEEKAETLTAEKVVHFYLGNLRRQELTKNAAAGAPLLVARGTRDGPPLSDKDLEYIAEGLGLYTKNQRQYAVGALAEQGVSRVRIEKAIANVLGQDMVEEIMDPSFEMFWAEGLAEGRSVTFLRAAERRFQSVPDHLADQVRNASQEQVDDWLDRLYAAPDIEAVFNGSGKRTD